MLRLRGTTPVRDVEALWASYFRTRSVADRNALCEWYLPLVRVIAERRLARLPKQVTLDMLLSSGFDGLRESVASFDPGRKIKYETFAARRILGAMLDELRSMDPVPRLVRVRAAKLATARAQFHARCGRPPSDEELRAELGVSAEVFALYLRDGKAVSTKSLWSSPSASGDEPTISPADVIADDRQANPALNAQRRDLVKLMGQHLSRAERLLVVLYYYEEMTMREIGDTLGISESRVSQVHDDILGRLRVHLHGRAGELGAEK